MRFIDEFNDIFGIHLSMTNIQKDFKQILFSVIFREFKSIHKLNELKFNNLSMQQIVLLLFHKFNGSLSKFINYDGAKEFLCLVFEFRLHNGFFFKKNFSLMDKNK